MTSPAATTSGRQRLGWPLGWVPLALAGGLVLAVTLAGTWSMTGWRFQEWERTSSQFLLQLAVTAPLAAAAGTYYAGRVTPPSRIFAQRLRNRAGRAVVVRHLGLLTAAVVAGYLAGLTPMVVWTWRAGAWGHLDAPTVLTGVLALVAATATGYLLGALGRSAVLAPVAFALVLGVVVLGSADVTPLSPVPAVTETLGFIPSRPLQAFRIIVFLFVTAWAISWSTDLLNGVSRRPRGPALMLGAVLVVAGMVPTVRPPTVRLPVTDAPRECTTEGGVEYCVHPGHRAELAALVQGGRPVLQAYGFVPARAARVYDLALAGSEYTAEPVVWVGMEPSGRTEDEAAGATAAVLIGDEACLDRYQGQVPGQVSDGQGALRTWLAEGGQVPVDDRESPLAGKDREQMQAWIRARDAELAGCAVDW